MVALLAWGGGPLNTIGYTSAVLVANLHSDAPALHADKDVIAWLSSTKLCGAGKCLTKARHKLCQAPVDRLAVNVLTGAIPDQFRARCTGLACATNVVDERWWMMSLCSGCVSFLQRWVRYQRICGIVRWTIAVALLWWYIQAVAIEQEFSCSCPVVAGTTTIAEGRA